MAQSLLKDELPVHMLPRSVLVLRRFPLAANDKCAQRLFN